MYLLNNYNTINKIFYFAFSVNIIRKFLFDLEKSIYLKKNYQNYTKDNIFICGLARSGTTALLNQLYETNQFASLCYVDVPFILSPNIWKKFIYKKKYDDISFDRAHEDGLKISLNSPEAFEEVFWKTIKLDKYEEFEKFIYVVKKKYNFKRYLSKNNQNINRIHELSTKFPFSKILIVFRKPIYHCTSLLRQHIKFISLQKNNLFIKSYMEKIGHSEFGLSYIPINQNYLNKNYLSINHWLEQWHLTYKKLINRYKQKQNKNYIFICYENICDPSQENLKLLYNKIQINENSNFILKNKNFNFEKNYDSNLLNKCNELYNELCDYC